LRDQPAGRREAVIEAPHPAIAGKHDGGGGGQDPEGMSYGWSPGKIHPQHPYCVAET
jgi:hypothetical protein